MKIKVVTIGLVMFASLTQAFAEQATRPKQIAADFLAACAQTDPVSQNSCDQPIHINIMAIGLAQAMKGKMEVCLPQNPSKKSFEKLRSSIVEWIAARPELAGEETSDAVYQAMKELHPCS